MRITAKTPGAVGARLEYVLRVAQDIEFDDVDRFDELCSRLEAQVQEFVDRQADEQGERNRTRALLRSAVEAREALAGVPVTDRDAHWQGRYAAATARIQTYQRILGLAVEGEHDVAPDS